MKILKIRYHIIFILVTLLFCCCSRNKSVDLHAKINNISVYSIQISYYNKDSVLIKKSIPLNFDSFYYTIDDIKELTKVTLFFYNSKQWTTFFIEPGDNININGDERFIPLINISGGDINNKLTSFKQSISELFIKRRNLIVSDICPHKIDSVNLEIEKIDSTICDSAECFIRKNPNSIASVILINDFFFQKEKNKARELLNNLSGKAAEYCETKYMMNNLSNCD